MTSSNCRVLCVDDHRDTSEMLQMLLSEENYTVHTAATIEEACSMAEHTEYDLYVGSWRMDGVVQIQKKHCGEYTILKRIANFGPPSPNVWRWSRAYTWD